MVSDRILPIASQTTPHGDYIVYLFDESVTEYMAPRTFSCSLSSVTVCLIIKEKTILTG